LRCRVRWFYSSFLVFWSAGRCRSWSRGLCVWGSWSAPCRSGLWGELLDWSGRLRDVCYADCAVFFRCRFLQILRFLCVYFMMMGILRGLVAVLANFIRACWNQWGMFLITPSLAWLALILLQIMPYWHVRNFWVSVRLADRVCFYLN